MSEELLADHGIEQTKQQCRERIQGHEVNYWKTRKKNKKCGSAPATCSFYNEMDCVLSSPVST